MTSTAASPERFDPRRRLGPIVALLAVVPGVFGAVLFLAPELCAQAFGLVGKDLFFYRLAGAASFGFLASFAGAWRDGWPALHITLGGLVVFAAGSTLACAAALVTGEGTWSVGVILVISVAFLGLALYLLMNPPASADEASAGVQDVGDWVLYLFAFGAIGALGTGSLALLLGAAGASCWLVTAAPTRSSTVRPARRPWVRPMAPTWLSGRGAGPRSAAACGVPSPSMPCRWSPPFSRSRGDGEA